MNRYYERKLSLHSANLSLEELVNKQDGKVMNCFNFITANIYFQSRTIMSRLQCKASDGHDKHYAPNEIIKR